MDLLAFSEINGSIAESSPQPQDTWNKPRLGKFLDIYSPEHLNLTPKSKQTLRFGADKDENPALYHTPERFHKADFVCSTVKPLRNRVHYGDQYHSFEANQSFPRIKRRYRPIKMELDTPSKSKPIDIVRVDGPNGLRFNTSLATSEIAGSPAPSQSGWQQAINTSKAVFTVEPSSFKILIVNNKACSLLGYASSELCGLKFIDLLNNRSTKSISLQAHDSDASEDGTIVLLSGKVVELSTKGGGALQVSLWIRQLDNEGPCLIVAEPVTCKNVVFLVESEGGTILSVDSEDAALIFGAEGSHKLAGLPLATLVPSVKLPETTDIATFAKQKLTGRTIDGGSFPLCLWICKPDTDQWNSTKHKQILEIHIRVTFNVSGLLVVDESSRITACNPHFAKLTFGKDHSEVIGRHIDEVIPNFCRDADLIKSAGQNRDMTLSPVNNERRDSVTDTDEDSCGAFNGSQKSACTSFNVQPSLLSQTLEKSSSALCLDKSAVTHSPTPTQDMVSSISTTEHRMTNDLPDVTSGISGISIDDDAYCQSSISKSRSENILRSEQSSHSLRLNTKPSDKGDISQSEEITPTGNNKRIVDPSVRLSLDSSKYKSLKAQANKEDKTSFSLDFCDSNETSADFLTPINEMPASGCEIEELPKHNGGTESTESLSNDIDIETQTESAPRRVFDDDGPHTPHFAKRLLRTNVSTSTPQASRARKNLCDCSSTDCQHKDGTYRGIVLHKDGTELNVVYTVSSMALAGARRVRCVWLSVGVHTERAATSLASTADNDTSLVPGKSASSRPQSMSLMSQCGEEQVAGEYSKHYVTLKQIGKGAYGCVKLAYRRSDRLLCVAKFVVKEKVGEQFLVEGPEGRKMPLELSLLLTLNHPNIVSVMDVYENDKYFQMVMERHGAGMDLFEFIERRPRLDEPLISYIFRQIAQAIEYLHSLNILHRDIKDENVIIDNKFQVKLIDFGSATFMAKDTLFSTFYGTTEYCSPEVLAGNKYAGPELEMWSMGITLYVLVFFVNPFSDIEDTIQGPLIMHHPISEDLEALLRWMLCKDPVQRCSVSQLMSHAWIRQPVTITNYIFRDIVSCDRHEANPEMYYSGSLSTKSGSQISLGDAHAKDRSNQSEVCVAPRSERGAGGGEMRKRNSVITAPTDQHSDNYSLRSSADILDISSKPVSDALTDSRSDATGHAACDIDCDCELYDDSWDECEQDSFS